MANDGFMKGGLVTALGTWLKQTFAYKSHTHAGSEITSGTLDINRIPGLTADKITSGTFSTSRIPSLDASKITSGTFDTARIPTNISITGNAATATTATNYASSGGIATALAGKANTSGTYSNLHVGGADIAYGLMEGGSNNEIYFEMNQGAAGDDMFDLLSSSGYSRIERAKGIDTGIHWTMEESTGDLVFTYH